MSRCDLEKKKLSATLWMLMQFMAFHSRERLMETFRRCYNNHRDIKQVLDMITTQAGYVKLIGQTLVVILIKEIKKIIFEHFEYIEQQWEKFQRRRQK